MTATPISTQLTTMTFNGVTVNGVKSITGLGSGSASEIDITTLASTAKESQPGLRDFGSIELDIIRNHDDLGQIEMFNSQATQSTRTIVVTLPQSTNNVATFSGYVKSMTSDIGADSVVMGKVSIRVTGAVAWS